MNCQRAAQCALDAFGLSETQLVCMIYSPFIAAGQHLKVWLLQLPAAPEEAAVRALLIGESEDVALAQQLTQLSGLSVAWRVSSLLDGARGDAPARVAFRSA